MTKAQEVYERIEALVASGVTKADAFRQLAEELGQSAKSLQGAYYQHTKKLEGGANGPRRRSRKRETTPADALEDAKTVLQEAIDSIDGEIEQAKNRADEAKAEYDAMKASATERKQAIADKIKALGS
jgi:peptidoglycan hydrolase CwlO-like protein